MILFFRKLIWLEKGKLLNHYGKSNYSCKVKIESSSIKVVLTSSKQRESFFFCKLFELSQ